VFLHKNLAIWSWLLIQDPLNVGNRQGEFSEACRLSECSFPLRI